MIRGVAIRGGLRVASRLTLPLPPHVRGIHISRLCACGDSFDVVTPILAKKGEQSDTKDRNRLRPPPLGGASGSGRATGASLQGKERSKIRSPHRGGKAPPSKGLSPGNAAAAGDVKAASAHVRTGKRPSTQTLPSNTVAHTRKKRTGKPGEAGIDNPAVATKVAAGKKTQSRKAEKKIEKQNYIDTHVALTAQERKLQHELVDSLIKHIKLRDHDAALGLYRQHESMFNSRMHLQSLLSVCWRHEHLPITEELVEKLLALFSGTSSAHGTGAAVPESALLSLIRCYTAVDTPDELRSAHIRKALEIVRKLQKSNLEPRLRTYVPILASVCRTGDLPKALDIVDEMGRARVYLREPQILMILATVANMGRHMSLRTQRKLMQLIDTSGVGLRVVPVSLLHTLLAAYEGAQSEVGCGSFDSTTGTGTGTAGAFNTEHDANPKPMRRGNDVLRVGEKETPPENSLSLSYWLNKMFGFNSGDSGSGSGTKNNAQQNLNLDQINSSTGRGNSISSWGANGSNTTKMTIKELVADRGVMVNKRCDIPGQVVVDRLHTQRSDVWIDMSGGNKYRGNKRNGTAVGHQLLDERLSGVAVAVNHYYSNPLDTPVLTRENAAGDMTVAVFADDESGNGSGNHSPGNFGPKFHSVQHILEKKAAYEASVVASEENKANAAEDNDNINDFSTAYQPKVADNIYKEKFFLHLNPFEPFRKRHRSAKPAALVELTKMGDGANAAHVCPNCGDELRRIHLTSSEKAFMRNALMESARECGDASSLQMFANYLKFNQNANAKANANQSLSQNQNQNHNHGQGQSPNQNQNLNQDQNQSRTQNRSPGQSQGQSQNVLYVVDGANVAYHRQNFVGGKFSYRQIELVVKKLEKKITVEKAAAAATAARSSRTSSYTKRPGKKPHTASPSRSSTQNFEEKESSKILVILPHAYVQRIVPNMSKNFEKRAELVSKEDRAIIDKLKADKMLYVVPPGCNDDWYWMFATVSDGGDTRAHVVTNDLMRDHKVAFSPSQKHSDACFKRWRESNIIHFDFSKAAEKEHPTPEVILVEPSPVTREMQTISNTNQTGAKFPKRIHIPAVDRSSWGCFSLAPDSNCNSGSGSGSGSAEHFVRNRSDLARAVDLFNEN